MIKYRDNDHKEDLKEMKEFYEILRNLYYDDRYMYFDAFDINYMFIIDKFFS